MNRNKNLVVLCVLPRCPFKIQFRWFHNVFLLQNGRLFGWEKLGNKQASADEKKTLFEQEDKPEKVEFLDLVDYQVFDAKN